MMKFKLHNLKSVHGRLGCIYDVERLPSFKLETPNILFYTKGGCIPHLTQDVLQMITTESLPIQIPLATTYHTHPMVEKCGKGIHSFVGLPEYLSYCTIQDPIECVKPTQHRQECATILSRHGRVHVTKDEYMKIMEIFIPDMYVALSDGGSDLSSGSRRLATSVDTTMSSFRHCFDVHSSSSVLKNKGLIAPVVGGYNVELREKCAKFMSSFPVLGFLIDGLYADGQTVPKIPHDAVENILSSTLSHLPEDSLKVVHGAWDPKLVLKMVKLGVDLFDSTYPYVTAENGFALTFDYNAENLFDDDVVLGEIPASSRYHEVKEQELAESNRVVGYNREFVMVKLKAELVESPYLSDLHDRRFFDDFSPILEKCDCSCCRKHTRAYIYHLLETNELLGPILLTIHNLHHYMKFFEKIREILRSSS